MYLLGRILKVRGNKGEVIIKASPDIIIELYLKKDQTLILKSIKHQKTKTLEYIRYINHNIILKFKDIHSIEDAYRLIGYSIYTMEKVKVRVPSSLVNFSVKTVSDELWGTVFKEIIKTKNTYLEVKNHKNEIFYIPKVDEIIIKIDEEKKEIIIDPPQGLKNINK